MLDLTPFRPGTNIDPYTLEVEFGRAMSDSSIALREVYELWRDFFADNQGTYARITGYPLHWELFVRATWQLFLSLPEEEVFIHFRWQIPTAFRLGLSVEENVFFFLYRRYLTEREREAAYRSMRQMLIESEVPINPAQRGSISIRELTDKRKKNYRQDIGIDDSSTLARIESELFPETGASFSPSEEEKIATTRALLAFIDFIRTTDAINSIINEYIVERSRIDVLSVSDFPSTEESSEGLPSIAPRPMPSVKVIPEEEEERDSRMTYAEIRALIDHRFGKDESGSYRNVEGVLATLESFAEKYSDERISELLYFDENQGMFVWNEELLNS